MRQIYIDLTTDRPVSGGTFIGYIGEHNATELLISIPQTMVNESDYQTLVFQVGPMVFKSKKITEDTNENTYRDGNTIHTVLSKSITTASGISLQVECYKENTDGDAVLIGKTQTVPNLILKLSPTGCPAFGYDGSYEEIDRAIRDVHRHQNLTVLNGLTSDDNGNLFYNGIKIGEGIERYVAFSEFPETAIDGCIACLENDEEEIPDTTPIERDIFYKKLRLKENISLANQSLITSVFKSQYGLCGGNYTMVNKDGKAQCAVEIVYAPSIADILALLMPDVMTRASYNPPETVGEEPEGYYMFNFIENWDASSITDDQQLIIPRGWNTLLISQVDYTIDDNCNIDSENYYETRPIDFKGEGYGTIFENVKLVCEDEAKSAEAEKNYLSNIFEVPPTPIHKKGMYIFIDGQWTYLTDAFAKLMIVESYPDLPINAPTNAKAIVTSDKAQLDYNSGNNIYISVNNYVDSVYFTPLPSARCKLYDYEMTLKLATSSGGTLTPLGAEISIVTNIEKEYILVTITDFDGTTETVYIYSWKDQTVAIDNLSFDIYQGWNKLEDGDETMIAHKLDYTETPQMLKRATDPDNAHFYVAYISAPRYPNRTYFYNYLIYTSPFYQIDNAKGAWIKTQGLWEELGTDKDFVRKEE